MFLYGGVAGYLLYLCAWWMAWRAAPRRHPARFLIPTVFAASLFSLGPLFLPYNLAIGSRLDLPHPHCARTSGVLLGGDCQALEHFPPEPVDGNGPKE